MSFEISRDHIVFRLLDTCCPRQCKGLLLTMAGEAPAASNVLAMKSMETKFVMHCMSGASLLTFCHSTQADSPVNCSASMVLRDSKDQILELRSLKKIGLKSVAPDGDF